MHNKSRKELRGIFLGYVVGVVPGTPLCKLVLWTEEVDFLLEKFC